MALSSTVVSARDPALPRLQVILVSEGNIVTILTSEELLSQCMMNQKNVIYGDVRSYSCWECDMHVSDESWLYKHLAGEKHRWVKKRVDQRLPVFWEPQQIVSVQRVRENRFTKISGVINTKILFSNNGTNTNGVGQCSQSSSVLSASNKSSDWSELTNNDILTLGLDLLRWIATSGTLIACST